MTAPADRVHPAPTIDARSHELGDRLNGLLAELYPDGGWKGVMAAVDAALERCKPDAPSPVRGGAIVCSMYADQWPGPAREADGPTPLRSTILSARSLVGDAVVLHILPPFLCDPEDRFSLIDDGEIDPAIGSWADLERAGDVMLDLIVNQLSQNSPAFEGARNGSLEDLDLFMQVTPDFDLSKLQSPAQTSGLGPLVDAGDIQLWSSHGGRQIDLDYRNPTTLALAVTRLAALAERVRWVRLDGIAYAWKESGTSCANRPGAQSIAAILTAVWDELVAGGGVAAEVDSYDDDRSFAHTGVLTLNYRLPPALALATLTGDVAALVRALASSSEGSGQVLNVGMTHDGLTLRPWEPVLTPSEIADIVVAAEAAGLELVRKPSPARPQAEYELHETWADLAGARCVDPADRRSLLLLVHAVLLAAKGVPYLYLPGLVGQPADRTRAGRDRVRSEVTPRTALLLAPEPLQDLQALIRARSEVEELWPASSQEVRRFGTSGVAIIRKGSAGTVVAAHNFGSDPCRYEVDGSGYDLLTGAGRVDGIELEPFALAWIRHDG